MAKTKTPAETIRNRVKELRMIPASELKAHPQNWRRHPKFQRGVLHDVLAEIGFAGAVIARETPEGLQIIDGHLRAEVSGEQEVPVLVLAGVEFIHLGQAFRVTNYIVGGISKSPGFGGMMKFQAETFGITVPASLGDFRAARDGVP